ncbi:WD repeat-containing protein 73 [Acipenser ruthenus]|uniref:WD repeat-containing protein 73 n=1 Tax=Acipenser ruthenus TaxID=7906 RepID=UPI0027429722|nr:WD repeat-containing protein 73 [Acipenser ruthenus]
MEQDAMKEDELDDWLIELIKLYSDLHVFELQETTQVIEWTGEKSICVAGSKSGGRNEILELALPQRLYSKQNQGLCPERDFKVVHGGFSDRPISCLKHIRGTRILVSSGPPDSSLQLWQIGADDSDVIKPLHCIHNKEHTKKWSRIATSASGSPCVLHGSEVKDIQVTDLESKKAIYSLDTDNADSVSSLELLSKDEFLLCSGRGHLWLVDMRQPGSLATPCTVLPQGEGLHWCMGIRNRLSESDAASSRVARLSSSGHVLVTDMRDARSPLCQAKLNLSCESSDYNIMTVTWAPAFDDCLAVSGFNGKVHIYNTKSWIPAFTEEEPLFIHKGHAIAEGPDDWRSAVVTTHVWHPWKPRTLLSAATNGSLHVWDWIDQKMES